MDRKLYLTLLGSMLLAVLGFASSITTTVKDTTLDNIYAENSSTQAPMVFRRRPSVRAIPSGNRFSLMNSRFNRRPKKKNLHPEHLMDILGDYFDPEWMSVEKPEVLSKENGGVSYVVRPDGHRFKELRTILKNSNWTSDLLHIGGEKLVQDPFFLSVVEKWLMRKISCPVLYAWEDVGSMFWPRWIRRGECATVPGTCSWPPGMHCVPSDTTHLHILRWQCRQSKSKPRRKQLKTHYRKGWDKKPEVDNAQLSLKCNWIRVPYPITSECLCTC